MGFPIPQSPEARVAEELIQLNDYMEILINLFIRAFPHVRYETLEKEFEEAKRRRKTIGFTAEKSGDRKPSE